MIVDTLRLGIHGCAVSSCYPPFYLLLDVKRPRGLLAVALAFESTFGFDVLSRHLILSVPGILHLANLTLHQYRAF